MEPIGKFSRLSGAPPAIESGRRRAISSAMAGTDLVPIDSEKMHRDQARVEAGFWDKLRRTIPRIPFLDEVVAAYYCATDPATPLKAKADPLWRAGLFHPAHRHRAGFHSLAGIHRRCRRALCGDQDRAQLHDRLPPAAGPGGDRPPRQRQTGSAKRLILISAPRAPISISMHIRVHPGFENSVEAPGRGPIPLHGIVPKNQGPLGIAAFADSAFGISGLARGKYAQIARLQKGR